ncbi:MULTISPECIES: class I SAM-dependent methyltransferase [unclassified Lentimicrobium]|uniref:class I SAM-dependent methyltransferase n=1 Tax=unclassified Lentimicrobium TaxID=2677434 RepID=UPI0015554C2B|nr:MULTISPECIES: class I SAM-dependent methyltransferase [unclassified Lentimicrobium]NPD45593.1 class I SAM-dependent methyltransferase [Lentimicrobium sp. S6]NPD86312.1 class I SAM-dependent methyltransferase [Lentimicrobium sp. L6]
MICTLCGSTLIHKIDTNYYDCDICKAILLDETHYLNADEEKAIYEAHINDVTDIRYQDFTSPITHFILENFLAAHKGLDFGSGTGPVISSELMKKGYDIVQYDPFFAPKENLLSHSYDYIASCEVFEHFYQPKKEIDRLVSLLNENGSLLIMTILYHEQISFRNWSYRKDPTHVFIYRKETIEYIADEYKLEIEVITDRFIALRKIDGTKFS